MVNAHFDSLAQQEHFLIKWDQKFAIGIPLIDQQHIQLVKLCNDFYVELMASRNSIDNTGILIWKDSLSNTLKACVEYVSYHFSAEEKLMQTSLYENFQDHKRQHNEFSKKILETASKAKTWNFQDALNFVRFLYDWILSHIAHVDKLYVPSLKKYLETQNCK